MYGQATTDRNSRQRFVHAINPGARSADGTLGTRTNIKPGDSSQAKNDYTTLLRQGARRVGFWARGHLAIVNGVEKGGAL
jgi:hypothetical protein